MGCSFVVTLLDMPDDVLNKIFEDFNFFAMFSLRRVCKDIRNFIDNAKPDINVKDIEITLMKDSITFNIWHGIEKDRLCFEYQEKNADCLTSILYFPQYKDHEEYIRGAKKEKKILMNNLNYVNGFFKDFQIILGHQKKVLDRLTLVLYSKDQVEFMEKFHNLLKSSLLKTKNIGLKTHFQSEILQVLPFINPRHLQKIDISYQQPGDLSQEIVNLEQWKRAKELDVSDFTLAKLEYCMHFERVKGRCDVFLANQILALKEKFLQSCSLKSIELIYNRIEYRTFDILGPKCISESYDEWKKQRWFYQITPNCTFRANKIFCLRIVKYSMYLCFYEVSEVPAAAIVQ